MEPRSVNLSALLIKWRTSRRMSWMSSFVAASSKNAKEICALLSLLATTTRARFMLGNISFKQFEPLAGKARSIGCHPGEIVFCGVSFFLVFAFRRY